MAKRQETLESIFLITIAPVPSAKYTTVGVHPYDNPYFKEQQA